MNEEIEEDGIPGDEEKELKKGWFNAGMITIILAFILPFVIMLISWTGFSVDEIAKLGAVGDFFGGSTIGLLSIASIFFIIHTINIQSNELGLQRVELRLTRSEMKETRKVHEEANKTMLIQRFETTFFNLLSLHGEIVKNISVYVSGGNEKSGRPALLFIYNDLRNIYMKPTHETNNLVAKVDGQQEKLNILYMYFFRRYGNEIGHYFRNLFRIMKFIDKSLLTDEDKREYIGILRAQLSSVELRLLFYNCISDHGQNFEDLVLKYDFFDDHLKREDLLNEMHFDFLN